MEEKRSSGIVKRPYSKALVKSCGIIGEVKYECNDPFKFLR